MARQLVVEIVGDAARFNRAVDQASHKTESFGSKFSGMAKGMALGAGAAGVGLAVVALKGVVGAAMDAEKSEVRLKSAFDQVKTSAKDRAAASDAISATSKRAALDDEDLSDVFSKLVRTTGDVTKSTEGMNLAADIARSRNVSLEVAAKAVEKAYIGSAAGLKKFGVETVESTANMDFLKTKIDAQKASMEDLTGAELESAKVVLNNLENQKKAAQHQDKMAAGLATLTEAQKQFAGSAEAYGKTTAGAQDKAKVAFENLQEAVGKKLLPVLAQLATKLTEMITWAEENWPRFQKAAEPVFDAVKTIIEGVITAIKSIAKVIGDVIKLIIDIKNGDWDKVWGDLKTLAVDYIQALINTVLAIPIKLAGVAKDLGEKALDKITNKIGEWVADIKKLVDDVVGFFTDLPGRIASAIEKAAGDAAGKVKDAILSIFDKLPGFVKSALGISSPSKVFEGIGEAIIDGAIQGMKNKSGALIDAAWDHFTGMAGSIPGGSNIGGMVVEAGKRMAAARGWTGDQWEALHQLWTNESGWNPEAVNKSSGAGGIPQALPSSKMGQDAMPRAQGGGGNFIKQIGWGLDYIAGRYGSPMGALSFWNAQSPHWYAKGGVFNQPTIIGVGEAGPEAVIPLDRAGGIGGNLTVHVHGSVMTERDIVQAIRAGLLQSQNSGVSLGFN